MEKHRNDFDNNDESSLCSDLRSKPEYNNSNIPEIKISFTEQEDDVRNAEEESSYQRSNTVGNGFTGGCKTKYGTEDAEIVRSRQHNDSSSYCETTPLIVKETKKLKHCNKYNDSDSCSDDSEETSEHGLMSPTRRALQYIKTTFLCAALLGSIILFIMVQDNNPLFRQATVSETDPLHLQLPDEHVFPIVHAVLKGKFLPHFYDNFSDVDVFVTLQKMDSFFGVRENMSTWKSAFAPAVLWHELPDMSVEHYFDLQNHEEDWIQYSYRLVVTTNARYPVPLSINITEAPRSIEYGVIFATCILVALYVIIVFDLIHRTLAAMWSGIVAMGILALLNEKPTLGEVMGWMDIETLALLFGMMVLVAILCETGFFDYVAVLAYKIAKGKRWTVITLLCFFTGIISAFLDNVTTILLFTPVTIRLCEVMEINPKFVLIALVMFSNVGGTATAVGDPPNVIIVSNTEIASKGIGFANFTLHMSIGSVVAMVVCYFVIRLMYRKLIPLNFEEPQEVVELRHEILIWKRAAGSLSLYSRDEKTVRNLLLQKVEALETLVKKKLYDKNSPANQAYEASLLELQKKFRIRNYPLLIKTAVVMFVVILLFFLHSIPQMNISLGWIAIMGSIFLLVLADMNEVEHIFARVEWTTLVFFAALFAVMEALNELGLLKFIGTLTENFIKDIPEDYRLGVSIVLIVWVSAIASSFIDNIPFTTVMLKIVLQIADNPELKLPLQPLVWSLAFGACFGGNGTLIGASANVVCAGVAEQHGYRFTFMDFFKIGFPVMLVTTTVATVYLLICHCALDWNQS